MPDNPHAPIALIVLADGETFGGLQGSAIVTLPSALANVLDNDDVEELLDKEGAPGNPLQVVHTFGEQPTTLDQLQYLLSLILPNATIGEDLEGQVEIFTDLRAAPDGTLAPFDETHALQIGALQPQPPALPEGPEAAYEVTYPLTFVLHVDEVAGEPSDHEALAERFNDMIGEWVMHGGEAMAEYLKIRKIQAQAVPEPDIFEIWGASHG